MALYPSSDGEGGGTNPRAMASTPVAMASNLVGFGGGGETNLGEGGGPNLRAMASTLVAMASKLPPT